MDRQKTSHHHSCAYYKGDLYVPDLGTDRIDIYNYDNGILSYKNFIQLQKKVDLDISYLSMIIYT